MLGRFTAPVISSSFSESQDKGSMNDPTNPDRRQVLELCIAQGILAIAAGGVILPKELFAASQQAQKQFLKPTPHEAFGPLYLKGAPNHPVLRGPNDPGVALKVSGRVLNTNGQVVEGAVVNFWQADHRGVYDTHGYRYRTQFSPGSAGEYSIETVIPGHYPDRPAQHLHYLVKAPGHRTLVTESYFATDPFFEGNVNKNWNKRGIAAHKEMILPVSLFEDASADNHSMHAEVTLDIVLQKV
jgi:protocatechuate 3,4-dioxygenase beta subunit